jgi:hypothetical protein
VCRWLYNAAPRPGGVGDYCDHILGEEEKGGEAGVRYESKSILRLRRWLMTSAVELSIHEVLPAVQLS